MDDKEDKASDTIDAYFERKDAVHELFGYDPSWVEIPLDDQRDQHWMLVGGEEDGAVCVRSPVPLTKETIDAGDVIYSAPLYTQRHLPRWVYRTATHVLVSVDTRTDGNKFLMIFDAFMECADDELRALYRRRWG